MIQTIRIGRLLRETVTLPYRCLVTRPTGAAVRTRIEAALAHSDCHTAWLDFSDVELLDLSCADEVVAKLLLAEPVTPAPFLVLRGLREEQHEAIEHVLISPVASIAPRRPNQSARGQPTRLPSRRPGCGRREFWRPYCRPIQSGNPRLQLTSR